MIDLFGMLARWLEISANTVLLGSPLFFVFAGFRRDSSKNEWLIRLERLLPWLAGVLPLALVGVLAAAAAQITGEAKSFMQPSAWLGLIENLELGKIWLVREILAVLLFAVTFYVVRAPSVPARYLFQAAFAALTLGVNALAGHPAAEGSALTMALFAGHILFAGIWFGGLPAFLAILLGEKGVSVDAGQGALIALHRFSRMALPAMVVVIASGLVLGYSQIEPVYASLVATRYGWLLTSKVLLLLLILALAASVRQRLPALGQGGEGEAARVAMRRLVAIEFGLAILLVLIAAALVGTLPGKHDGIENWPYPFRWSLDATLGFDSTTPRNLTIAGVLLLMTLAYPLWRRYLPGSLWRGRILAGVLGLSTVGFYLYGIAIVADPFTYRPTTVAFDAISIDRGKTIFLESCAACHGLQAKGDGPLAKTLPKKPVDLLTEPHTKQHTAGDFYYWITTGFPQFGMPPFGDRFTEDDRWDLVNFIHMISRGYEGRTLRPQVVPNRPQASLGAPNFSFAAQNDSSGTLKDYRQTQAVIVVLFSWPESRARMEILAANYPKIRASGAEVIAIPVNGELPDQQWLKKLPYPVAIEGAREAATTYAEFRRTIKDPDLYGVGVVPDHLELLVDRFGYLRARWLPSQEPSGWNDFALLFAQLEQLKQEKEILPPAGDHVH